MLLITLFGAAIAAVVLGKMAYKRKKNNESAWRSFAAFSGFFFLLAVLVAIQFGLGGSIFFIIGSVILAFQTYTFREAQQARDRYAMATAACILIVFYMYSVVISSQPAQKIQTAQATPASEATQTPATQAPQRSQKTDFLTIKPDQIALLDNDGGSATTATVCVSAYAAGEFITGGGQDSGTCTSHKDGQRVKIMYSAKYAKDPVIHANYDIVQVKSINGGWTGFISASQLMPILPIGTLITITKMGELAPSLANSPTSNSNISVQNLSTARVLAYTDDAENFNLRVEIIDGNNRGQRGWTSLNAIQINSEDVSFKNAMFVNEARATPTSDSKSRVFTLQKSIRLFHDFSICEDAFNAMHDDAALARLRTATDAGDFDEVHVGDQVHIVDDLQPNSPFLIVEGPDGKRGCMGRYELPGY